MWKLTRIPSHAARQARQVADGRAVLFGLPFIIAGLGIGGFVYFPAISTWWSACAWEEVPCWIEKADLNSSRSRKGGTTSKATASYRYEYRGRTYHSEKVGFTGGSDNIGDFQQRAYAEIRAFAGKDRPFRCYVNPAKPEQAVIFRELRWGLMLMMSVFPMLFPLVGALISLGGLQALRKARAEAKLAQQYPSEPWRWRQEWGEETIRESKNGLPAFLIAAGWILLVQGPLALGIIVSGALVTSYEAVFALLPTALALIPLFFAWQRLQTRLALGKPSLWLKQTPLRPGAVLEGELRFDRVLSPREVIQARVLCQRKITLGSGRGSTNTRETIWQHNEMLFAAEARREISGVALPLRVEIPNGLPCEVIEDAEVIMGAVEQHPWSLEIASARGGKPAVLPLPVFTSREEAEIAANLPPDVMAPSTKELAECLKRGGLFAEFDEQGIPLLMDCTPGRFRALAVILLIFGIIWFSIFIAMVKSGDAPLIFRLIWGTTAPLIIGQGLFTLLHRRRVEFRAGEMIIVNRIGPFYSWRETFAPRHIVRFKHDSNTHSVNQRYYRVRAETTFGKTKTLADGITESVIAAALVKRFEEWKKRG